MKVTLAFLFLFLFLQLPISAACEFPYFYTTADDLEIKEEPKHDSKTTKTISRLKFGRCIEKSKTENLPKQPYFYQVRYEDATEGWVDSTKIFFIKEPVGTESFHKKKAEVTVSNIRRDPPRPTKFVISFDETKQLLFARGTFYFSDGGDGFLFVWKIVEGDTKLIHTTGNYAQVYLKENRLIEVWPNNSITIYDFTTDNGKDILAKYLSGQYSSYRTMEQISFFSTYNEMRALGFPNDSIPKTIFDLKNSRFTLEVYSKTNLLLKTVSYTFEDGTIKPME